MSASADNFYACWRRQCGVVPALNDGDAPPPERLLQAIWLHQRFRRDQLRTLDGRAVRILHPGFLSVEGGPDFRGAVIQLGGAAPASGDIEVDLKTAGWRAHGHDINPTFRNVVLHVVWAAPKNNSAGPPVLAVADSLDAPLAELAEWLGGESVPPLPEQFRGRCSAPLRGLGEGQLQDLLRQAALVRLRGKAAQLAARARDGGWEQSLWEGLFRALGYKHNPWPMQQLAELRGRWSDGAGDVGALQARLLGIANLLPPELTRARPAADGFVRQLWDRWWRERDAFEDCLLPRSLWRLHAIRPVNHPQRRLALAAHWLAAGKLVAELERWGVAELPVKKSAPGAPLTPSLSPSDGERVPEGRVRGCRVSVTRDVTNASSALAKMLQPGRDEFWTNHLTLRSARSAKPQPLLGEARVTDLAVNVILPWLWARSAEGRNPAVQAGVEARYLAWPAGEDNSVLKLARQRLLGGAGVKAFRTAAAQQGLLQIVRDFCDHSNAVCDACRFPELVRAWCLR